VAHVIRLISITVAGAAPGLDESTPDFPFYSRRALSTLAGSDVGRAPHAVQSLPAKLARRQGQSGQAIDPVSDARAAYYQGL
jgi:hypothetical protein